MGSRDVRAATAPRNVIVSSHGMSEMVRSVTQTEPAPPSSAAVTDGHSWAGCTAGGRTRPHAGERENPGEDTADTAVRAGRLAACLTPAPPTVGLSGRCGEGPKDVFPLGTAGGHWAGCRPRGEGRPPSVELLPPTRADTPT